MVSEKFQKIYTNKAGKANEREEEGRRNGNGNRE